MLLASKYLLTFLLGASSALAAPSRRGADARTCGSEYSQEAVAAAEARSASMRSATNVTAPQGTTTSGVTIPVYWHIISAGSTIELGNISDQQITDSVTVLNKAYAGTGFSFTTVSVDRTVNSLWFNSLGQDNSYELAAKTALKKAASPGGLDLYTTGFLNVPGQVDQLLGFARLPADYATAPILDGVVILYSSVPGGSKINFNLGITAVHEIGHWLGLYHPFQGGCLGGDLVDDTPPEAEPATQCMIGRDSCPGGGVDLVTNYMDYSWDSCMTTGFTPGQVLRMQNEYLTWRNK